MDRLSTHPASSPRNFRSLILAAFLIPLLAIMAFKVYDEGWLLPRTPLELNGKPAVLFYNRHKGCECALIVYRAADRQVQGWTEEDRRGVQLVRIDLDRRPDLGTQYGIMRAPSLLLLNADGSVLFQQTEIVHDNEPLDLPAFGEKMAEVLDGQ